MWIIQAKIKESENSLRRNADLAYALGLDSTAAIANYEKGSRTPKPDVRKKIATHYMITEDELVHSDFSGLNVVSLPFDDTVKMQEMTTTFLPIICTVEALAGRIHSQLEIYFEDRIR